MYESVERVHKDTAATDLGGNTAPQNLYAHSRLDSNLQRVKKVMRKDANLVRKLWFGWKSILKMPTVSTGTQRLQTNTKSRTSDFLHRVYCTGKFALENFSDVDPRGRQASKSSHAGKNLDSATQHLLKSDYLETIFKPHTYYSVPLRPAPRAGAQDSRRRTVPLPDSPELRNGSALALVDPDNPPDVVVDELEPYFVVFEFLGFIPRGTKFVNPSEDALPAFINEMQVPYFFEYVHSILFYGC